MTQTHTQGPWRIDACPDFSQLCELILREDGKKIASVNSIWTGVGEQQANARLIAAAPELLEALDNLAEHIDSKSGDFAMRAHFLKEAFAAIAKARGQA